MSPHRTCADRSSRSGALARAAMFDLTKWYLDLVTPEGSALVVYVASLRWGLLHVEYAATLLSRKGRPLRERTVWSGVRFPRPDEEGVHVSLDPLGLEGRWVRRAAPVSEALLDDEHGRVQWDCLLPGAEAHVRLGGGTLEGRGYVECLTMTCPPWSLPLRTLHWGRFISPCHALVWIRWEGTVTRGWSWLDGVPEAGVQVAATGVDRASGGGRLTFARGRELYDRKALRVLSRRLPTLEGLPLGPLRDLRETKRLDRGIITIPGEAPEEGWALHEVVRW